MIIAKNVIFYIIVLMSFKIRTKKAESSKLVENPINNIKNSAILEDVFDNRIPGNVLNRPTSSSRTKAIAQDAEILRELGKKPILD